MLWHMLSRNQSLEAAILLHSAIQDMEDWTSRLSNSVYCYLIMRHTYLLLLAFDRMMVCFTSFVYPTPSSCLQNTYILQTDIFVALTLFLAITTGLTLWKTMYGADLGFFILYLNTVADFLCPFICPWIDLSAWKFSHNLRGILSAKTLMHSLIHSILKFS